MRAVMPQRPKEKPKSLTVTLRMETKQWKERSERAAAKMKTSEGNLALLAYQSLIEAIEHNDKLPWPPEVHVLGDKRRVEL